MMTAEKLDEADALHGQYGKSESINQSLFWNRDRSITQQTGLFSSRDIRTANGHF